MSTLLYINLGSLTYDSFKAALLCSFIVVATADAHIKHGPLYPILFLASKLCIFTTSAPSAPSGFVSLLELYVSCSPSPTSVLPCLLNNSSWYQENTSRTDAQEILMSQPVGAFLIRSSRKPAPGDFSISVRCI